MCFRFVQPKYVLCWSNYDLELPKVDLMSWWLKVRTLYTRATIYGPFQFILFILIQVAHPCGQTISELHLKQIYGRMKWLCYLSSLWKQSRYFWVCSKRVGKLWNILTSRKIALCCVHSVTGNQPVSHPLTVNITLYTLHSFKSILLKKKMSLTTLERNQTTDELTSHVLPSYAFIGYWPNTVSHRREYTPHIFVNILLYIFMWQHWRNDTLLQCKVVSVQLV